MDPPSSCAGLVTSTRSSDRLDEAIALYRRAAETDIGDSLADCPYDGWATLSPEELRMAYLDRLGRWSGLVAAAGGESERVKGAPGRATHSPWATA